MHSSGLFVFTLSAFAAAASSPAFTTPALDLAEITGRGLPTLRLAQVKPVNVTQVASATPSAPASYMKAKVSGIASRIPASLPPLHVDVPSSKPASAIPSFKPASYPPKSASVPPKPSFPPTSPSVAPSFKPKASVPPTAVPSFKVKASVPPSATPSFKLKASVPPSVVPSFKPTIAKIHGPAEQLLTTSANPASASEYLDLSIKKRGIVDGLLDTTSTSGSKKTHSTTKKEDKPATTTMHIYSPSVEKTSASEPTSTNTDHAFDLTAANGTPTSSSSTHLPTQTNTDNAFDLAAANGTPTGSIKSTPEPTATKTDHALHSATADATSAEVTAAIVTGHAADSSLPSVATTTIHYKNTTSTASAEEESMTPVKSTPTTFSTIIKTKPVHLTDAQIKGTSLSSESATTTESESAKTTTTSTAKGLLGGVLTKARRTAIFRA